MNDDQFFLANAYLDGELTAEERRTAEADPEVMSEVEELRALQSALRDVPPPTAAARESAIDAAMAQFGGTVVATPPGDEPRRAAPVVPFRPRPAYAKYLGIAAACVAVAGLGIVLAQSSGGSDDAADSAAEPVEEPSLERDGALTESLGTADADAAESEIMAADEGDEAGADMANEDTAEAQAELAPEPAADEMGADDAADTPSATEYRVVPAEFDPGAPIDDDVELGVYGAYLLAERDADRLPPTPNHSCDDAQQILDEATLQLDDELVPVYVDVREIEGRVAAMRTDTCAELLQGSLYAD